MHIPGTMNPELRRVHEQHKKFEKRNTLLYVSMGDSELHKIRCRALEKFYRKKLLNVKD